MVSTLTQSTERCITVVRKDTDTVILFCSFGKDSLVALDIIAKYFSRIVVVFMYFVQGLEHIERYARWVKSTYPNVEIVEIPHWNLTYIFRSGLYCTPNPNVKLLKLANIVNAMKIKYGINWCFLGMKKADSMNRRLMLDGYKEAAYTNNGMAYPLAEWTQANVLSYMRQHKLPSPVRYSLKASSGVGFDLDCFKWLEKNYPSDLEKIYKVFPLSKRILFEEHYKKDELISKGGE